MSKRKAFLRRGYIIAFLLATGLGVIITMGFSTVTEKTNTKFLIITHHALTMSRMDRLFGVTMAERGISQIVSVDLKRAEEIGAVA